MVEGSRCLRGASSRGRKRVVNVMVYQRVEILTGTERRRNYTPAEKVRIVEEAFRPGVIVKDVARRLGIHESLLYRWRRLMGAAPNTSLSAIRRWSRKMMMRRYEVAPDSSASTVNSRSGASG